MLRTVRWTVFGLLALSVLILAFAVGYVARGDDEETTPSQSSQDDGGNNNEGGDADFGTLNQIQRLLEDKYVDPDLIDRETLYQAAINGMIQTLGDSGTFYVDPQTVQTSIGPSGTFEGIGATVSSGPNGEIVIVAPIENTPAARAGIQPGDVILSVDGESTDGWTQEKAVIKIRGPRGTTVTLDIRHPDGTEEALEIERDEIQVESVTTLPPGGTLKDGAGTDVSDVAYVHIREFSEPTTDELTAIIEDAERTGKAGIILDVRNNPGGLLSTTVEVADEFLDSGTILSERERDGSEQTFAARRGGAATSIPVVILQNRFSASGAEVLAAALRDNDRATIVGEKSFGKGTVNSPNGLGDGGQLYVSIAKWLTPNGTQIDGVGIRPDIEVQLSDEDIDARRDVQLWKALDVLRGTNTTPATALTPRPITPTPAATTQPGG